MTSTKLNNANRSTRQLWQQPMVAVFAALALGTALDRWFPISIGYWFACAMVAWLLWFVCYWKRRERQGVLFLLFTLLALAAAWNHWHWTLFSAYEIGTFAQEQGEPVCLLAEVADEPLRRKAPPTDPLRTIPAGDRTEVSLHVRAIRDLRSWRKASGTTSLFVDGHLLGVHAGDEVRIFGQLTLPTQRRNPGEFDRAAYERADRIHSVVFSDTPACVEILSRHAPMTLTAWASRWRRAGVKVLQQNLTEPQSQLAAALLLGDQDQLGDEPVEAFFTTGMLHVLVVSGMHVVLLAGCLFYMLKLGFLARRPALLGVIGLVIGYALLTGGRPPAMRAATLVSVFCLAQYFGRSAISASSLAASAVLVWVMNPADLFRTGPQLSFLAVMVLTWIASWRKPALPTDPLDRLIYTTRPAPIRACLRVRHWLVDLVLASSLVWMLLTPLTSHSFHLFSPVSLLLTPLLWVPISGATVFGFALLVVGSVAPPLAMPIGWICGVCLDTMQAGVEWGQRLPGSYAWIPGPATWWVLGFYAGLGVMLARPRWRPPKRWQLAMLAGWAVVGLAPALLRQPPNELRLTFISVEHGLSVLVELPGGKNLLYDAGRIGSPHLPARSIASVLWSRGISHLDAVVISHADADHYNALPELLERFSVGVVYVSPMMFERDTPALNALKNGIAAAHVPLREIWAGDRLDWAQTGNTRSSTQLEILHPPRQGVLGSDNANSIVLEIVYAGRRVMLTGDLEAPGLNMVMAELPSPTDILLAPHHGSVRSDPPGFAAWATPRYLVISGGDEAGTELVRGAYENVGAQVLHTSQHGAITAIVRNSGEVNVNSFR